VSRRTLRVAELIRTEVARILAREAADPRLEGVTVTRVEVSADLSDASIRWRYLDPSGERSSEEIEAALVRAAPFVRARLSELLALRRVPALHFRLDTALEEGDRTLAVLRELATEREARSQQDGDGEK